VLLRVLSRLLDNPTLLKKEATSTWPGVVYSGNTTIKLAFTRFTIGKSNDVRQANNIGGIKISYVSMILSMVVRDKNRKKALTGFL
jgi:hypothetical protein